MVRSQVRTNSQKIPVGLTSGNLYWAKQTIGDIHAVQQIIKGISVLERDGKPCRNAPVSSL